MDHHEDTKTRNNFSLDEETEQLAHIIVDAIFLVHSELGPGLLESVYESCLTFDLERRGISIARQQWLPIRYRGHEIDAGLRLDLVVEDRVILELKAVERLLPVHKAQLITYLKLSGKRLGFLVNFNSATLKEGLNRVVL